MQQQVMLYRLCAFGELCIYLGKLSFIRLRNPVVLPAYLV